MMLKGESLELRREGPESPRRDNAGWEWWGPDWGWEQKTRMMWKAEQVESGSCLAGQGSNVQGSPRRNPARFGNIQLECQPATIRGPVDQAGETRGLSADDGGSAPAWRDPVEGQDEPGDVPGVGETTTEGEVGEQAECR